MQLLQGSPQFFTLGTGANGKIQKAEAHINSVIIKTITCTPSDKQSDGHLEFIFEVLQVQIQLPSTTRIFSDMLDNKSPAN